MAIDHLFIMAGLSSAIILTLKEILANWPKLNKPVLRGHFIKSALARDCRRVYRDKLHFRA